MHKNHGDHVKIEINFSQCLYISFSSPGPLCKELRLYGEMLLLDSIELTNTVDQETSIDVLPSKNQALSEYCTLVSKLKHYRHFNIISIFPF